MGRTFLGRDLDNGILERIVDLSDELTAALSEQLGSEPPVGGPPPGEPGDEEAGWRRNLPRLEHEAAAFAAAGIDLAVATDVMGAFRGEAEGGGEAEDFPLRAPAAEEIPQMRLLLERAGAAFGEGEGQAFEGGAPGPPWVIGLAGQTVDELVRRGSKPAAHFGAGLLSLGLSEVAGAVGSFEPIHELVDRARDHLKLGMRLLRSGIRKLARIVGSEDFLAWIYEKLIERFVLHPILSQPIREAVVRRLVRSESSLERVSIMIDSGHTPTNRSQLEGDLDDMCRRFARNMWWAEVAERLISRSAPIVAVVGVGLPGHAGLAAAYGVGLAACLFTLADRLDTVPLELGWVRGVPTLVRES